MRVHEGLEESGRGQRNSGAHCEFLLFFTDEKNHKGILPIGYMGNFSRVQCSVSLTLQWVAMFQGQHSTGCVITLRIGKRREIGCCSPFQSSSRVCILTIAVFFNLSRRGKSDMSLYEGTLRVENICLLVLRSHFGVNGNVITPGTYFISLGAKTRANRTAKGRNGTSFIPCVWTFTPQTRGILDSDNSGLYNISFVLMRSF